MLKSSFSHDYSYSLDDLFYFYDVNEQKNIYNEVKNFNQIFIENLAEKSARKGQNDTQDKANNNGIIIS